MIGLPAQSSIVCQPGPTETQYSFSLPQSLLLSLLLHIPLTFSSAKLSLPPQRLQSPRAFSCSETGSLVNIPNALNQHGPACFPATTVHISSTQAVPPPVALRASRCRDPILATARIMVRFPLQQPATLCPTQALTYLSDIICVNCDPT